MAIQGVDYSSARPSPSCLFTEGKRFAIRYTNLGEPRAKTMTLAETTALTRAGLRIVTIFEETAGHMLGGAAAGDAAAKASWRLGKAAGMPPEAPHFFALDVDTSRFTASDWAKCAAYLDAAAEYRGRHLVGLYADIRGINKLRSHAPWLWQTYAWSRDDNDVVQWASGLHLRQYRNNVTLCGGGVDLDDALQTNYGGWRVGAAVTSDLQRAQAFARSCDPIPYRMVYEVSRDGIDCSGMMSVTIRSLMNEANVWVRLFSTGTIKDQYEAGRLPMLHAGLGDRNDFNIGVMYPWESSSGIGHTAGTLGDPDHGGFNVESRGGVGVLIGPEARGATNPLFRHHYHVKIDDFGNLAEGREWDEMATEAEVKAAAKDALIEVLFEKQFPNDLESNTFASKLRGIQTEVHAQLDDEAKTLAALASLPSYTPEAIARAVVAALPASSGGAGLTEADVEEAVRRVFSDAGTV